jgi:hypothetical protein
MNHVGPCVGGPYRGGSISSIDNRYPVALMSAPPVVLDDDPVEWLEIRRGLYEYDSGIWWWRGWGHGSQPP